MRKISVVLVEDHHIVREGIRLLLDNSEGVRVVGDAADGNTALALLAQKTPDVLLLDINLQGSLNGVDVVRRIKQKGLPVRILVLSAHASPTFVFNVLQIGVHGYLLKKEPPTQVIEGIRGVALGQEYWFSKEVMALMNRRQRSDCNKLSKREEDVLRLLCEGMSNFQIAENLCISDHTVKNHLSKIFDKAGVNSRSSAMRWGFDNGYFGLVSLD